MASVNLEYLREHGPSPISELPVSVNASQRAMGMRVFKLSGNRGSSRTGKGRRVIYYLDEHTPEEVIRAYCELHPNFVEEKTRRGFTRAFGCHGKKWREAALPIARELGVKIANKSAGTWDAEKWGPCPLCGEDLEMILPRHLETNCDETQS